MKGNNQLLWWVYSVKTWGWLRHTYTLKCKIMVEEFCCHCVWEVSAALRRKWLPAITLAAWLHVTHRAKMLSNMMSTVKSREQVGEVPCRKATATSWYGEKHRETRLYTRVYTHTHHLDTTRLASSVLCKTPPFASASNNRPWVFMLTSLPSMEKVWQVDPQGIWDGQGILQVP